MKIQAIALDMDGTILKSDHHPSETTKKFLSELEEKGIKIIIATGRSYEAAEHIVKELELKNEFVICYNGAQIINTKENKSVYEKFLKGEAVKSLINIAENRNVHINLYQDGIWYVDDENSKETKFYSEKCGIIPTIRPHDSFENYAMPKVIFIGEHEKLLEIREEVVEKLGHCVNTSFSSRIFLEVMDKNVNKGETLKWLLNNLGIDKNKCAAFGDAENDLEMLLSVKYGVAMGNANQELKDKVNYVTLTNDEDGVVDFLQNL